MIIRVLGMGQYRLQEADMGVVQAADRAVEDAMAAGDEAGLQAALAGLAREIARVGQALGVGEFHTSDLIVPGADTTLAEAETLLGDDGAIPGR